MKKKSPVIHLIIIGLLVFTSFTCERDDVDDDPILGTLQPVSEDIFWGTHLFAGLF